MRTLSSSLALPLFLALRISAADFSAGLSAYQKKDYAAAVKEWRPLAEKGDAPSQFNLGLMYVDGLGVPQDYNQALSWFERSAQQDYAKAQLNLGAMYASGKGVKRDLVAGKLKPKQLVAAQKLSSEFTPKQEPGKSDPDNPDK